MDPIVSKAITLGKAALANGTHTLEELQQFLAGHVAAGRMTPQQHQQVLQGLQSPKSDPFIDLGSAAGGAKIELGRAKAAIGKGVEGVKTEIGKDVDAAKSLYGGARDLLNIDRAPGELRDIPG